MHAARSRIAETGRGAVPTLGSTSLVHTVGGSCAGTGGVVRRAQYYARVSADDDTSSGRRILMGVTGLSIDGGVASVTRSIARALDEETAAGRLDRVDRVLLLDESPPAPPLRGSQYLAHGSHARFALRVRWEMAWRRSDLAFFDLAGVARPMQLPLPLPRPPYAVFCHGEEFRRSDIGSGYARAAREASRLVTNSHHTAAMLRDKFAWARDQVRVAPLCIDPARLEEWAGLAPPSFARSEPIALIVGRMWSEERGKGHDQLLEAWPSVLAAVPKARLQVVGDGDDRARLEHKAAELGLADAVDFLGRISDDELVEAYRRAALFTMPSRQEGFGLVYAEAMWHGLPCLATFDDAGSEVVRDGATGRLVPYGDVAATAGAIAELLGNSGYCSALGEAAAREARERFGYERFKVDVLTALGLRSSEALRAGG